MEVVVKYLDYVDTIEEVQLIINKDQKKVLRFANSTANGITEQKLQMETIDETISFSVSQELNKNELRDFIQICQKMLGQMLNTKN